MKKKNQCLIKFIGLVSLCLALCITPILSLLKAPTQGANATTGIDAGEYATGYIAPTKTEIENSGIDLILPSTLTSNESLPSNYDLRDQIPIRIGNQNPFGTCYTYSANTVLETFLEKHNLGYYDFSEAGLATATAYYMNRCVKSSTFSMGGNFIYSFGALNNGYAPILDTDFPTNDYITYDTLNGTAAASSKAYEDFANLVSKGALCPVLNVSKAVYLTVSGNDDQTITNIKNQLIANSAVAVAIKSSGYYTTASGDVTLYYTGTETTDHAVTIVGFDDNYSKNNFNSNGSTPNKDGAFIVANSWGTSWGNNGYFYVSYEDACILTDCYGITEVNLYQKQSESNYDRLSNPAFANYLFCTDSDNIAVYIKRSSQNAQTIKSISAPFYTARKVNVYLSNVDGVGTPSTQIEQATLVAENATVVAQPQLYKDILPKTAGFNQIPLDTEFVANSKYILVRISGISKLYLPYIFANTTLSADQCTYLYNAGKASKLNVTTDAGDNTDLNTIYPIRINYENDTDVVSVDYKENSNLYVDGTFSGTFNLKSSSGTFAQPTISIFSAYSANNTEANGRKDYTNHFDITTSLVDGVLSFSASVKESLKSDFLTYVDVVGTNLLATFTFEDYKFTLAFTRPTNQTIILYHNLPTGATGTENLKTYLNSTDTDAMVLAPLSRSGYTFAGWYTSKTLESSTKITNISYSSGKVYNLYPKFEANLNFSISSEKTTAIENVGNPVVLKATYTTPLSISNVSYEWYKNNVRVSGESSSVLTLRKNTDSGIYTARIIFDVNGETFTKDSNALTVTITSEKLSPDLTVSANQSKVWNGLAQTPTASINNSEQTIQFNLTPTNVGTYSVFVWVDESEHYASSSMFVNFQITKATPTFTYDAVQSASYNGLAQTPTVNLNNTEQTLNYSSSATNCGTYNIIVSVAETAHYRAGSVTIEFTITPIAPVLSVADNQSFVFNGTEQVPLASLNNSEQTITYSAKYTNAGTYTITVTAQKSQNYTEAHKQVTYTIAKADSTISAESLTQNVVYTGAPVYATVTCTTGQTLHYSLTPTEAGTYTIEVYAEANQNYNQSNTLSITLIVLNTKVVGKSTADGKDEISVTFPNGISPTLHLDATKITDKETFDKYEKRVTKKISSAKIAILYNLEYTDNGEAYTPASGVKVRMLIPENMKNKNIRVVTFNENGTVRLIANATRDGDYLEFTTNNQVVGIIYDSAPVTIILVLSGIGLALVIAVIVKIYKLKHTSLKKKHN